MAPDFLPGNRRICPAYTGEDHTEIVIYFRTGGNSGTGITGIHLLLYGYCRRYTLDQFHIRLGHPPEELSCI